MKRIALFMIILTMMFGDFTAVFSASTDAEIRQFKKEATDIKREIAEEKNKIKEFTQKEAEMIISLNETEMALNNTKKQVDSIQEDMDALQQKIKTATEESKALKKKIQSSEAYASRRMVALYKLNCSGKINLLASAESVNDFFRRKSALERILSHDENVLKDLSDNKAKLSEVLENLNTQKKEKRSLEKAYKEQVRIMSREKKKREALLSDIRKKKSLTLASIDALKQSANALEQKIKKLSSRKSENVSKKSFTSLKGLLKMPVMGEIISLFGTHTDPELKVKNFQRGIDIQTEKGSPIRAARAGEVVYSSWFKGYGNMMIIDHGGHYHTVYAHADKLLKKEGDKVKTDEVIATAGDTGSMKGSMLHFEVRHHGKAVNPMKWLKKK